MLEIQNLHVKADDKEILRGVNLNVGKGEIHVILGSNGSGKSTLMNAIMGHPKYQITSGKILFEGEDLTTLKTFERARRGIFLSFQNAKKCQRCRRHFFFYISCIFICSFSSSISALTLIIIASSKTSHSSFVFA